MYNCTTRSRSHENTLWSKTCIAILQSRDDDVVANSKRTYDFDGAHVNRVVLLPTVRMRGCGGSAQECSRDDNNIMPSERPNAHRRAEDNSTGWRDLLFPKTLLRASQKCAKRDNYKSIQYTSAVIMSRCRRPGTCGLGIGFAENATSTRRRLCRLEIEIVLKTARRVALSSRGRPADSSRPRPKACNFSAFWSRARRRRELVVHVRHGFLLESESDLNTVRTRRRARVHNNMIIESRYRYNVQTRRTYAPRVFFGTRTGGVGVLNFNRYDKPFVY